MKNPAKALIPRPVPALAQWLPVTVLLLSVTVPWYPMPPPSVPALFPETVELFRVKKIPELTPTLAMPPEWREAVLPETVELLSVNVRCY